MALITDLRLQMLGALGESDISVLSASLQAKLLQELNATCQWIYTHSPGKWWAEHPEGDSLIAPTTLSSMTVTAASKSFSGSGLTSRMHGCTVQVSGQNTQNRIFQTALSTWEFLMPHNGSSTSSASITVWHDCLNLAEGSISIFRPVMIPGVWELMPLDSVAALQMVGRYRHQSHGPQPTGSYPVSGWDRQAATPQAYYVDGAQLYSGAFITQIRLHPMPDAAYQISWFQRERFSAIASFADTRTHLIPQQYESSVLVPLILERLIKLPNFQYDKAITKADAMDARKTLATLCDAQESRDLFCEPFGTG